MAKTPPEERKLNPEQKKAVEFGDGPLLIIAGAGTGKTTVVTERIKYFITSGKASPQEILALTFTEKASREMEERVDIALPYGTTQMWISTFHAFCDRILRNEVLNIGLNPGYTLMSEATTIQFFKKHLFSFELEYFRPLGNPAKFISGMINHFSRLKDEDVTPEAYKAWANKATFEQEEEKKRYTELSRAYAHYEALKAREGVADYGDLITNTLAVFRKRPSILKRYQQQFKYILIDEFQDTNFAQNELAVLLAGKRKNITVVGDDDQAIYRWRGAAISNMIQFRKRFPKAKIIVLTKNYRSSSSILDESYRLIQGNNPDRLEVAENIDKHLESTRKVKGKTVEVLYAERVENEAEAVAKKIESLLSQNDSYTYSDVAILVRANNQSEPFAQALGRFGIPFQFLGPGQLFRQPEIKDLIAYLKLLSRIDDNVAMYRVLSMDWLKIPARDVASIVSYAKKFSISFFEAAEDIALGKLKADRTTNVLPDKSYVGASSLVQLKTLVDLVYKHLDRMKKDSAGQILYDLLQMSGLLRELASFQTTREEKRAGNIAKFFNKLKTFEAEHDDASVYAVVDWITLSMDLGESPLATDTDWSQNNAVNILTIHSSKGLEFPIVFLVNLVSSRFPSMERKDQIPIPEAMIKEILPTGDFHLQEERRLFYVGMTRARDYLFFTAAKFYGEGKREKKLSQFIGETIGEERVSALRGVMVGNTKQLTLLDWMVKDEPQETVKQKHDVPYLSYSQLDTFLTCPLQYKYRYIVKIPVPPAAALTFGDTIHRTVKAFYDGVAQGEKPTYHYIVSLYDRFWSSLGFGDRVYEKKVHDHGQELLKGFIEKGFDKNRIPSKLEESFKIKITPYLTLGGKIDRIDPLPDGKIEIIDYKTGQAPKSKDVTKDLQLTVYAMAARDEGILKRKPEDVIVSFYFFEGQEKISASRTQEQLDTAKEFIAKTANEISTSDFRPTPGKHCDFCEFRLICEAWQ